MSTQNLIIYKFTPLYHILEELGLDLNFNITFVDNENSLNIKSVVTRFKFLKPVAGRGLVHKISLNKKKNKYY